jgi:hypothetical protein
MAGVTSVSAVEAGRVLFAIGDVRIIAPDGSSRAAKRNDIVQNGERMQTAKGALGQVRMINGERVGVRGGSKVRLSLVPANPAQPRLLESACDLMTRCPRRRFIAQRPVSYEVLEYVHPVLKHTPSGTLISTPAQASLWPACGRAVSLM